MEPNEQGLSSFYNHPPQLPPTTLYPITAASQTPGAAATASPPPGAAATASPTPAAKAAFSPSTNGLANHESSSPAAPYPQSVAGKPPSTSSEPPKRKRGRPRKYGTPEAAAAAERACPPSKKKEQQLAYSKKSQIDALGNAGQCFTPHVISIAAGEDVSHRILLFSQQVQREVCILSASGSICNVSLRQPSASGGSVTYEGQYSIISLSGSYMQEQGGRAGGLSACLVSAEGKIIGGCVGGPLTAAGPVEVILASFVIDMKKGKNAGVKVNTSAARLPSPPMATPISTACYRPGVEHTGRFLGDGNNDHQNMGGTSFMFQQQGMNMGASHATDWRDGLGNGSSVNYDFTGRGGRESNGTTENGNFEQLH